MTNGENDDAYEVDGAKTQTLDNVEGVNEVEAAAKEMSVKKARSSAADDSDYESDSDEFDNGGEATESESASVGDAKQLFDQKGHNKKGGKTNRHDTSTNSDNEDANKGDDMKTEPLADDEGAAQEETAGNEKWVERASYTTEDHSNTDSDSDKLADGGATEYESAAEDSITKKAPRRKVTGRTTTIPMLTARRLMRILTMTQMLETLPILMPQPKWRWQVRTSRRSQQVLHLKMLVVKVGMSMRLPAMARCPNIRLRQTTRRLTRTHSSLRNPLRRRATAKRVACSLRSPCFDEYDTFLVVVH